MTDTNVPAIAYDHAPDRQANSLSGIFGMTGSKLTRVCGPVFAYLFHRIDFRAMKAFLAEQGFPKDITDPVRKHGYLLLNCKLYTWHAWHTRMTGVTAPRPKDYGLALNDNRILNRMNLGHLPVKKYPFMTLPEYQREVTEIVTSPHMQTHMSKFISKKLLFLVRSYNLDRKSIENTMIADALLAMYMTYPRYTGAGHMVNVAKAAIHNAGQGLIQYHVAPARQRLIREPDGTYQHALLPVVFSDIAGIEASPKYKEHCFEDLQALSALAPQMSAQVQAFLMAMAGHHDPGLSEHLGQDNSDAADTMPYATYQRHVQKYFGVVDAQVEKLYSQLRDALR